MKTTDTEEIKMYKILIVSIFSLFVVSCNSSTAIQEARKLDPATKAAFCDTARAILWSKDDTFETKKQIKEHNAVFKAICRK